jgi:Tfp pilus assembly protein PilF
MSTRALTALVVVGLTLSVQAHQGTRPGGPGGPGGAPAQAAKPSLIADVQAALGHGSVADAERAISASNETSAKEFATALVEIYQGKDDQARPRLAALAQSNPLGDASLELGLLDLRHGQRDAARRRLDPMTNVKSFNGVDDYFRLARAARAMHEFQLANDAYQQIPDAKRADIQTARGDLFLYFHQPADAIVNFRQALAVDRSWVPALVGIARAYADDDPAAAAQALDAARKIAPEDPAVLVVTAQRALAEEDWTAAGQAVDRLASVKPNAIEEPALRAAIAYATNRPADIDGLAARAKTIDPLSALTYLEAGQQAAQLYHFDDAAALYRKGVAIDPQDRDVQLELGLALMRTGDESGARTALEASWTLDKSNAVTKNLLDMLDHLDAFTVVPDGDLTFKFGKDQADVLKLYALPLAHEAMKTFGEHYQFTPKGPILIEVFPKHDDFAVRTVGLPGIEGALGACFGRVISMDSPSARPPDAFSWQATLWHEMAHVYTLQLSKYRVPRWLTEGISVFEEHRRNPAWGREVSLQYAALWSQNKTFGVKGLPNAFKDPENFVIAYFEASLVVEHLVALKGDAGLRQLLLAYADGATDEAAFTQAFGQNVDAIDASFRQFVNTNYGALAAAMKPLSGTVDPRDVQALRARAASASGSFQAQLQLGQALVAADDDRGARAPLERAAELAPQAQGASSPHALLAQIDTRAGDNPGARRELRALLTHDHDNVSAARALTKLATDAHADTDRDYGLRLTSDLDPFDAGVHTLLGQREFELKHYEPALVEFNAALALGGTNPTEGRTNVAETLLALNRKDEAARQALLALEDGPTFARAQDVLLAARGPSAVDTAPATAPSTSSSGVPAGAAGQRYALLIEGVSGDETYAKLHRQWLDGMATVLKTKLGFDASHLTVMAETPGPGEQKATAEVLKTVLAGLAKTVKSNDLLFVMLIGHGAGEGNDVKFNLVGPDLSVDEWNALLKPVPGRLVFVDATSASYPFLKGLAGDNRIIVTATRSVAERFHTVFADGFIKAFSTNEADLDKNGRISIWEAFEYASKQVDEHYRQGDHLATEHAMLDDTGKGDGHDAAATGQTNSLAALTYLDTVAMPTTSDPALQALYERQRTLTDQIDELRRKRATMVPQAFDRAFEPLIVNLSVVSSEIRKKAEGKKLEVRR